MAILAGLGFAAVAGLLGLYWRDIYFAFYPEARFIGRWEPVKPDGTRGLPFELPLVLEFREEGELAFDTTGAAPWKKSGLIRTDRDMQAALLGLPTGMRYEATRMRVTFSSNDATVSAKYRFRTGETLVLEYEENRLLGSAKTVVLRRVSEP